MKTVKKILYGILFLTIALCALIIACAFNSDLTDTLAAWVKGDEVQTESGQDVFVPENEGNAGVYVPPALEDVSAPDSVRDKLGYEPIVENGVEIDDEDAEDIREDLKTGETGENISFDPLMYPYYAMLNEDMKALYRQIYANALELQVHFAPVVEVTPEEAKNVFEAVYNDHPELFWLQTSYSCKYLKSGNCIELTLQYHKLADDLEEAQKDFESAAQEILSEAKGLNSPLEKERYVHDALIQKVNYHGGSSLNQSAYSALVEGRSVCAGYARAFQYLMMKLGVPCYYCTGYSGEDHAWNIVKLDDGFYNVDVTWDDTTPFTYDYFNQSDADLAQTHVRRGLSVYLPVCIGERYIDHSGAEVPEEDGEEGEEEGEETEEQVEDDRYVSDVDSLINKHPQKPLTWDSEEPVISDLEELGLKEEDVMHNLEEYYADCLKQIKTLGSGKKQFTCIIPKALWVSIEQVYSDGSYEKGYVETVLKELEMEHFAIQLQTQRLNGSYYKLYHNISTWK